MIPPTMKVTSPLPLLLLMVDVGPKCTTQHNRSPSNPPPSPSSPSLLMFSWCGWSGCPLPSKHILLLNQCTFNLQLDTVLYYLLDTVFILHAVGNKERVFVEFDTNSTLILLFPEHSHSCFLLKCILFMKFEADIGHYILTIFWTPYSSAYDDELI